MNLYKISQNVNNKLDTYTAAVVVAINENRDRKSTRLNSSHTS